MKRIILLLGCCLSSLTNTQAQTLVIWNANSIVNRIELAQKPVVKVFTDKLQVTGDGIKLEYKAKDVYRFTFEEDEVGIESTNEAQAKIRQKAGEIIISGVQSTDDISLYDMSGIRVPLTLTRQGSNFILKLPHIPSGEYILNVAGNTIKLRKK